MSPSGSIDVHSQMNLKYLAHFINGTDPLRQLDIPLFEIKTSPGKERVSATTTSRRTGVVPGKAIEGLISNVATPVSSSPQNFPGKTSKNPFSGTFKTNGLPCGAGSSVASVYPTACFSNHSCTPNGHNNWNSTDQHETIHTIRPIKEGEEITISYVYGGPSNARQTFLRKSFGFTCACGGCNDSLPSLKASDDRRIQIQALDEAIGNSSRMMTTPHESLGDCSLRFQVLDKEFSGHPAALIARLYHDAFQISIAHGDQARANVLAERAYKARVICEGEDSPETLRVKHVRRSEVAAIGHYTSSTSRGKPRCTPASPPVIDMLLWYFVANATKSPSTDMPRWESLLLRSIRVHRT